MRLRPDKVRDLATQIVAMLREHPKADPSAPDDELRVAIGSAITDNLHEEDDIDREVDKLLDEHARQIDEQGMDAFALRQKFKRQIAKQRGFVL